MNARAKSVIVSLSALVFLIVSQSYALDSDTQKLLIDSAGKFLTCLMGGCNNRVQQPLQPVMPSEHGQEPSVTDTPDPTPEPPMPTPDPALSETGTPNPVYTSQPSGNIAQNQTYFSTQVFLAAPTGQPIQAVSPNHIFRTGDYFVVVTAMTSPGMFAVQNINSYGQVTNIGQWQVPGGGGIVLPQTGAFQFTGYPGREILRFMYTPCQPDSNPSMDFIASRSIVVTNQSTISRASSCSAMNVWNNNYTATRSIQVANGMSAYTTQGLSPTSFDLAFEHR